MKTSTAYYDNFVNNKDFMYLKVYLGSVFCNWFSLIIGWPNVSQIWLIELYHYNNQIHGFIGLRTDWLPFSGGVKLYLGCVAPDTWWKPDGNLRKMGKTNPLHPVIVIQYNLSSLVRLLIVSHQKIKNFRTIPTNNETVPKVKNEALNWLPFRVLAVRFHMHFRSGK